MKSIFAAALVAATAIGGVASADGIVERCFVKEYEPAQFSASQHQIRDESTVYVDRGDGRVDLVRHPAWYVERLTQTRDDRWVLRPTTCD